MDALIHRLIKWATNSIEPLQSYATGLLAAAMEIAEIATRFRYASFKQYLYIYKKILNFREQNGKLVPLMLQRLRRLRNSSEFTNNGSTSSSDSRPFAHLNAMKSPPHTTISTPFSSPGLKRRK